MNSSEASSKGPGADGMRNAWNKLFGGRTSVQIDSRPQHSQHPKVQFLLKFSFKMSLSDKNLLIFDVVSLFYSEFK